MNNLCYGMKVLAISQLPQGNYSHPNMAMDCFGSDNGIDFWFAQGRWKCIAGAWGSGTYFFAPVDANGVPCMVHCADGVDRIVTIALTHSNRRYIRTEKGKIYENGQPMYEEGTNGKATGNHIHLEVANGIQTTKTYDKTLGVYRMQNELNPLKVFYVNKAFTKVTQTMGAKLNYCDSLKYVPPKEEAGGENVTLYFVTAKEPCRIRESLLFKNGRTVAKILATMPKGAKAIITHFTERFEEDGYEWVQVRYYVNGKWIDGYCQLDTKAYLVRWD